jgi:hypothetical protein
MLVSQGCGSSDLLSQYELDDFDCQEPRSRTGSVTTRCRRAPPNWSAASAPRPRSITPPSTRVTCLTSRAGNRLALRTD